MQTVDSLEYPVYRFIVKQDLCYSYLAFHFELRWRSVRTAFQLRWCSVGHPLYLRCCSFGVPLHFSLPPLHMRSSRIAFQSEPPSTSVAAMTVLCILHLWNCTKRLLWAKPLLLFLSDKSSDSCIDALRRKTKALASFRPPICFFICLCFVCHYIHVILCPSHSS